MRVGLMKEQSPPASPARQAKVEDWQPPRVTWREPFEPMSFGATCVRQPGNTACFPGPYYR